MTPAPDRLVPVRDLNPRYPIFEGPVSQDNWTTVAMVERAARVELASSAWKAAALPLELRPRGGWCRSRTCPTQRSRRVSTALPYRSANHPYFVEYLGALGVNRTPDPPFRRRPLSSAELRGQVARHPVLRNGTSGIEVARTPPSVLVRVELPWPRHRDGERPQRVENLDGAVVLAQHIRQPAIDHRALVDVAAAQKDVPLLQPSIHLLAREAGLPGPFPGLVLFALRVHAAADATGAVHRRVEAIGRCLTLDAFEDHGVITHRTAHEAALAREGRGGTLAHDPQFTIAVRLAPGEVVVVVHALSYGGANDLTHPLHNPFTARVGIEPAQLDAGEVALPDVAIGAHHRRMDFHAILRARPFQMLGRNFVSEAARAKVHTDPYQTSLVLEEIDIVVAGPDGAELIARHRLEVGDTGRIPEGRVEQLVIDLHGVVLPDAEADRAPDVVENCLGARGDVGVLRIEPDRHVAARDVEADAADGDVLLVGHPTADRVGVAEVAVGT